MNTDALRRAAAKYSSQREFAAAIGASPARVWNWLNGVAEMPHEFLPVVYEQTGVAPREIYPDLAAVFRLGDAAA